MSIVPKWLQRKERERAEAQQAGKMREFESLPEELQAIIKAKVGGHTAKTSLLVARGKGKRTIVKGRLFSVYRAMFGVRPLKRHLGRNPKRFAARQALAKVGKQARKVNR